MKDTLKKFSGRADDYVAGRPAYAEEFVRWLALEQGFSEETIVADIGSGTGKFAKQLLKMGCFVYGIEPNDDMRKKAEENFLKGENFCSVKGTANKTTLKEHAVDVVTFGSGFPLVRCHCISERMSEDPEAGRPGVPDLECAGYGGKTEPRDFCDLPYVLSAVSRI